MVMAMMMAMVTAMVTILECRVMFWISVLSKAAAASF